MSYTGWVLVLLATVIAGYLTPMLIRRRQSYLQTPVEDRFSPGSQVIEMGSSPRRVRAERGRRQPQLLAHRRIVHTTSAAVIEVRDSDFEGESEMSARNLGSASDAVPSASREMARLRARRAARMAREDAAGKRRFAVVVLSLTTFVALAVMAFQVSLSPWWLLAPTAVAAAVVVDGRLAYRRSMAAAQAESEQLQVLREQRQSVSARRARVHSALQMPAPQLRSEARVDSEAQEAVTEPVTVVEGANAQVDATEAAIATGWTARELPPPTYATAAPLGRREVSAEALASLTAGGAVEASSPARPVKARSVLSQAQSTQEVEDSLPVAFDLEDVLELRRAQ